MSSYNTTKLLKHLNGKWVGRPCPLCQQIAWQVQDSVFELRQFAGGSLVVGTGPIVPVIPVICGNCGNTVLVNALISEAIDRPTDPAK
jgi:hypothetical protein